jgi:hypothetical protein
MTNEFYSSIGNRLVALRQKLKAREGRAEYKENVEAIKAEIAKLEAVAARRAGEGSEE